MVTNDNEPNPWTSISLAAALILNRLRNKQQIEASEEHQRKPKDDEQKQQRSQLTVIGWASPPFARAIRE